MRGKVVSYKPHLGYGFIQDEEGRRRFFRDADVISGRAGWGLEAEFAAMQDERGLAACQVRFQERTNFAHVVSLGDLQLPLGQIVSCSLAFEQIPDPKGQGYVDSPVLWLRTSDGKRHLFPQSEAEFDVEGMFHEITRLLDTRV